MPLFKATFVKEITYDAVFETASEEEAQVMASDFAEEIDDFDADDSLGWENESLYPVDKVTTFDEVFIRNADGEIVSKDDEPSLGVG